jgi:hypothetical protein
LGGEEISGAVEKRTNGRERGTRTERGRVESSNFSCLARLRSSKWSVSELNAEISYQKDKDAVCTARWSQDGRIP